MAIIPSLPITLLNGTVADATQVMANFNAIVSAVNANAANAGVNTNIVQLAGLTVSLTVAQGGTGRSILTPNSVLVGEGVGGVNGVAPGAIGTVLTSGGLGVDPSYQTAAYVPSGGMIMWPTATPPTGFIEANGQATTGMAALAAIYGANVPDMRGYFARAWDHGRGVDPNAPALLQVVADQFKSHTHTVTDPGHNHTTKAGASDFLSGTSSNTVPTFTTTNTSTATTGITNQDTGGTETAPKYIAWMFIIKT